MLLKLAWRNLWRNKRRSFITMAAVFFAAFMAIAMRGIQQGTFALNIKTVVNLFSGYMQVEEKGYNDNPSLNKSFVLDKNIAGKIKKTKRILNFTPRIYANGLISRLDESRGVSIFAIEPDEEKNVTNFMDNVDRGKFLTSDSSNEIVLGSALMDNLNAKIGDEVILLAQGYDGTLGNQKYKIVGTVKLGVQGMEGATVFMGIKSAQSLLAMGNRINVIAVKASGIDNLKEIKKSLTKKVNNPNLIVLLWSEVNPGMQQMLKFSSARSMIFLGILFVIIAFGILNTVLMSVTERFREFGVELSIGMPQIKLTYLVYIETMLLTLIGLTLGNVSGYLLNSYLVYHPIIFGGELKKFYESYHFLPQAQSSVQLSIFLYVTLSVIFISLLACIYPAHKVYKLEPLKGIRYT